MIKEVLGDLLTCGADIICHQTNCRGVMGAGVARQIRDKLLTKEQYEKYQTFCHKHGSNLLGHVQWFRVSDNLVVANLFGEDIPTGTGLDTDYDALKKCFVRVEEVAREKQKTVAIPGYIGCGLAGGDWTKVLYEIIVPIFQNSPVELTIVYFEKDPNKASLY